MPSRVRDCTTAILDQYRLARRSRVGPRIATARALFKELCHIVSANTALSSRSYVVPISRIGVATTLQRCPQVWLGDEREWRGDGWIETVIQFPEDMSGLFLGICVNCDEDVDLPSTSKFRRYTESLEPLGFSSSYQIDLRVAGAVADVAEVGWVASKWYTRDAIPDDDEFSADLAAVLQACDNAYKSEGRRVGSRSRH